MRQNIVQFQAIHFLVIFWEASLADLQYLGYCFRQLRLMDYVLLLFGVVEGEGKRRLVTENT